MSDDEEEGQELKISSFADDTQIYISDKKSLDESMKALNVYSAASGAKINTDKTKGVLLGGLKQDVEMTESLTWVKSMKALGIPQGTEPEMNMYWNKLLSKARGRLEQWKSRKLTLLGKNLIVKSLVISIFMYGAGFKVIPDTVIEDLKCLIWSFFWEGKPEGVRRNVCQQSLSDGGLGCVNIKNILTTKRIMLVKRIVSGDHERWKQLPRTYLSCLDEKYCQKYSALLLSDIEEEIKNADIPLFYKQCLLAWQEMRQMELEPDSVEEILNQTIWCNKWLQTKGSPLRHKTWPKKGINFIRDVVTSHGWRRDDSVIVKAGQGISAIMTLNRIMSVIPATWLKKLRKNVVAQDNEIVFESKVLQFVFEEGVISEKGITSKCVSYKLNKSQVKSRWQLLWEEEFQKTNFSYGAGYELD